MVAKKSISPTVGAMRIQGKKTSGSWWRSGHLHNTSGGLREVDFKNDWTEYFDAYARSYENNAFECPGLEAISRREVSSMMHGIERIDGDFVLEIGSGEGRLTRAMIEAGYKVQATDGAPGMVQILGERHPQASPRRIVLDGGPLPFGNATFDAVAGLRVWKYVKDRTAVLSEMRRVTKTGGLVVLEWTSKNGVSRFGYRGASINLLSRVTMEMELRSAGFDVVSHTTTTRIPQPFWKISSGKRYVTCINIVENILDVLLSRGSHGTLLGRSVVTVAKAA